MPRPTRYWYWQPFPYQPRYYAFLNFTDFNRYGMKTKVAIVVRDRSGECGWKWQATNEADPTALACGRARDEAVDKLFEITGGPG